MIGITLRIHPQVGVVLPAPSMTTCFFLIAPESFLPTRRSKEVLPRFGFPEFDVPQQSPDAVTLSASGWWGWVRRRPEKVVCGLRPGTHGLHTAIHAEGASQPHWISHVDKRQPEGAAPEQSQNGPPWRGGWQESRSRVRFPVGCMSWGARYSLPHSVALSC